MSLGSTEYTLTSLSSSSTFPMGKDCTVLPPKDHSNLGGRRVSPPFCKRTPFSGGRGRRDWYRPRLAACTCRFTVLGVRFRFKEGRPKPDLNPKPQTLKERRVEKMIDKRGEEWRGRGGGGGGGWRVEGGGEVRRRRRSSRSGGGGGGWRMEDGGWRMEYWIHLAVVPIS
jgi:hypothetical protein